MSSLVPVGRYLDVSLYFGYTVASVTGLMLIKSYLPGAHAAIKQAAVNRFEVALTAAGAALYIGSFLLWLIILRRNELSVAYPTAIGLTLVFSTLGAGLFLGEQVSLGRLCGAAVIFLGIVLVTRS